MPGYFDPLPPSTLNRDTDRLWLNSQTIDPTKIRDGVPPFHPKGVLGWEIRTTDVTGISALADVTGLASTVTVGTNRYIRVYGSFQVQQLTSAGIVQAFVRESTTIIAQIGIHTLQTNERDWVSGEAIIEAPSAGSHTYKLSLSTTAGTVDAEMTTGGFHGQILVEDLGSVPT